jgi:hypothetical protein
MTDIQEILEELRYFRVPFPAEAVESAIELKEEITPHLLRLLEETVENPEAVDDDESCGYLYALFLLAKFREQRAWPLLVRLVSAPDGADEVLGDVITESLDGIMASVCGDDIAGVKALIENPAIFDMVRGAAVNAIVRLVVGGRLDREEAMAYFATLFQTLERKPGEVWNSLGTSCLDLHPQELLGEIRQAQAEGLIDEDCFHESDIQNALALGKEGAVQALREGPYKHGLIDDVEEEMSWMAGFEEPGPRPAPQGKETVVRTGPKIGRNDPCPCGSGKKYKKCCLV